MMGPQVFNGNPAIFPDWARYISGTMNYPVYVSPGTLTLDLAVGLLLLRDG